MCADGGGDNAGGADAGGADAGGANINLCTSSGKRYVNLNCPYFTQMPVHIRIAQVSINLRCVLMAEATMADNAVGAGSNRYKRRSMICAVHSLFIVLIFLTTLP